MKSLSKATLALYLFTLLWLVLFKFSYDITAVVLDHQARGLNLVPFSGHLREAVENLVIFIPFGLLLSINFQHITFWRKLAFLFIFSVAFEVIQFILAIGITDITDVITNTAGGLFGLTIYELCRKYVDREKLDRFIILGIAILLIVLILLRTLVLRVRY